ncbi:MAG: hypothetical protein WDN06_14685 [Asticcacaulis sp.]
MVALVSLAACNKTQTSERPPEAGDVAVARVDGQTIWTSDVRNEAVAQGQIGPGEPLDMTSDLFERSLNDLIDQRLLAKAARDKGIDKSMAAKRRLQATQDRILGDMAGREHHRPPYRRQGGQGPVRRAAAPVETVRGNPHAHHPAEDQGRRRHGH